MEEDSPSPDVESKTQCSPDSYHIDGTSIEPHAKLVRNIVILGKIGTGKATIANMILGHPKFTVSTSVEGATRSIKDSTASCNRNGIEYNIKLIDTVGVRDTEPRSHILSEVEKFVESTNGIHLIIFVFKNSRYTKEDEEAFGVVTGLFKSVIENISLLVITCCEGLNKDARDELVDNFKTEEPTKQIAVVMKKGIVPVGFPDLKTVTILLKPTYEESILEDSKKLQGLIESCTESVSAEEFQKCMPKYVQCCVLI